MNVGVLIFSTLGGTTSFVTGIMFVIRAILKNVGATRENTAALIDVQKILTDLGNHVDDLTVRLAVVEDRTRR